MMWERHPIGELLIALPNKRVIQQGWSPKCHTYPASEGRWGVLKTTAIQAGRFEPEHNKELPEELEPRPNIEVQVGDLLLTCAGPRSRCGIPALVRSSPGRLMMSGKMYRLRPNERLDPRFLELYLLSDEAQNRIDAMKTGISDSGLNLTHGRFMQLEVPVPLIEEQRRVITILEENLSRLDVVDASLASVGRRSAILKDQLLMKELSGFSYDSVPFRELLEIGLANGKSVPTRVGGFPVLRLTSLRNNRIDLREQKPGDWNAEQAERFLVYPGDFLISRGNGSLHLVGRGGLVTEVPEPVAFPDTLIRARLKTEVLVPEYLSLVWNSPSVRRQIERIARTTAGIYKVNQKDLASVLIPVPSPEDQRLIATKVIAGHDSLNRLTCGIESARARSRTLRQSLLTEAFSGRLTGQDSNV